MTTDTHALQALLSKFEYLPKVEKKQPTLLEIAGFPHYENVCSNIIAFFFGVNEHHGFEDLFVKSLLQAANSKYSVSLSSTTVVHREYSTNMSQRIDLVIEGSDIIIVIENKIYASVTNDLEHYEMFINQNFPDVKEKVFVLLTLWPIDISGRGEFVNITYDSFFTILKANLGGYLMESTPKYSQFLIEFIKTIENLTAPHVMNQDILNFFVNNHEAIGKLQEAQREVENEIFERVKILQTLAAEQPVKTKKWIWRKFDLVHDFYFEDGVNICVDCFMNLRGTTIDVWVRGGTSDYFNYIKDNILNSYTSNYSMDERRFRLFIDIPFNTPLKDLAATLNSILQLVSNNRLFKSTNDLVTTFSND